MRYNTGNPVEPDGSSSPFDLYDNAGNIDLFANVTAPAWPDRLGRPRKSVAGMELDFANAQADKEERFQQFLLNSGYEDLGDYAAGIVLTGRNQVFRKDGELYRASAAIDLPYTTTGDWSGEAANFVSVGDAALRQELSGPGGAGLVRNSPVAGFSYDLATWSSRIIYAEDWDGVDATGATDSSVGIRNAVLYLKALGGGQLRYGPGRFTAQAEAFLLDTGVTHMGSGFGVTFWVTGAGANVDTFKSANFDTLTGVGPITAAPHSYGVIGGTIHGNYLDLGPNWSEINWRDASTVLNSSGCGIKSFGTRCEFRVEIFNVAQNAIYQEAIGAQFDNSTAGCRIWLDGRISGQEGFVMRGPGDSSIDFIGFGLCGLLPKPARAATSSLPSLLYPSDQVNGMVIDNQGVYEGHCEITRAHLYAVSFGVGIKTLGVCRLNALHLATDACLGGFDFSAATHGLIAVAEARGNGRQPIDYTGATVAPKPDLVTREGGAWVLEMHLKTSRYAPSGNDGNYAVQIGGSSGIFSITRQGQNQGDGLPLLSPFLSVTGDANNISFTCERQRGNVVHLTGNSNNIRGTCSEVSQATVLTRDTTAGSACFNNSVDITAQTLATTCTLFNAIGVAASENIRLLGSGAAGYTKFTGSPMAAVNRTVVWTIMALDGSSINGKSTEDYIEQAIPNTPVSGTIVVPHNFLYQPAQLQITLGKRFAGSIPDQLLDLGVSAVTATDVTIAYRWSALPSTGSATLVCHIR
ncbi:hypothetical protein AA098_10480 [Pseudomonas sp. JY-Q]|uniref:hypothetical protein n=1 Tax=Pseudomonas sp. JY-Q TaxID=1338689 RepID=UPI0007DD4D00|nr:hypothetical protein [Pseudomonas sp. JY-Q]ANI33881.1 hypothetical protein AA098_10480 [Pseudomonas sp. JY-Q]